MTDGVPVLDPGAGIVPTSGLRVRGTAADRVLGHAGEGCAQAGTARGAGRSGPSGDGTTRVRQISAKTAALGFGRRSSVVRSTATSPKRAEYPSSHSQLSNPVQ